MSNQKSNDIDQIRNLIFGQTIAEFDERFKKLENNINKIGTRLSEFLSQHNADHEKNQSSLENISGSFNTSINSLQTQLKEMRKELLEKLKQIESSKAAKADLARLFNDFADKINDNQ